MSDKIGFTTNGGNFLKNEIMSEIRPTSQQADREKLSQDIEKLKLAVKDTSLNRTWDDYSDSDDDALHITEDQNSRDVNDDGQFGGRVVGVVERFFPEEAIQGISQDSLGSLGSVELTNSPEVCLALNREYQDWIRKNLTRIQIVLEHNRHCQREVRLEMQEKSSEKIALNAKRKTLTVYAKPYFKTADGSFPPPNEDTAIKRNSRELDPFIRPPKTWTTNERNKLRAAVQADRLQKALRPFMNKKEIEVDRLRMITPDSEEEKQIKEQIEDIDNKMKAIRTSVDINMVYGDLKDLETIDWMKIANIDFEGQRTPEACELFWLNAAHPNINVLKWTSAEDTKLIELVSRFEGVHWVEIAQALGTNRSAFMCLQRYQTKLNPCLQTGKWTPEEDEFLKEVINNYKSGDCIPWSTVAYYVEGRSREQCARRWEQLHPKSFKKGKWTIEEDKKLMEAAKLFGVNKWWKIKEFVPGRTAAQCRERWKNTLDYSIHFGEWRYEEDRTLWLTVQELGAGHWQQIAKEYLPGRTDNMCLQRYRRLVHWYQENKAKERVKRQTKAGGWRQSRRWKRLTDKQYLKRKQMEKVLDRVKTEAKQNEILSALKYVEGICDEGQAQGDDGRLDRTAEQMSDLENRAVSESGDCLYSANEMEAIRRDEDLGIVIPRPSTRSCVNRNCLPELYKYRLRSDIGRRVASQLLSERRAPSSLRTRLDELISGKGTTGFSQPLQEKLQSLSDNATIRELIDLSAEVKQEVTSTLGSSSVQQRGRPKRSEEEGDVERKISMLVCDPVMGTRGFNRRMKFLGEDSSRTGLRSGKKNAIEDKQGKVVHLMANALGFRKCHPFPAQSSSVSSVSDATPQTTPVQPSSSAQHGFAKQAAKAISSLSPERSIVVVLKRASSSTANKSSQHTPQSDEVTPECTSCATSDPRLNPSMLKKAAYGRAALDGVQAKIYQMPPLPPSCSTLNAFKTLLLNRTKLLSVAGMFHIPGILPVPKSVRQQETLKTDEKSLDSATSSSGMETKASHSAESLEHEGERKEMGTQEISPAAETEFSNVKSTVDADGIRKNDGPSSNGLPSLSKRSRLWADCHKTPRKLSRLADKGLKQVVKSKLRSRRVLAAIHASHDYQLLRSRFLSLFLWPAFMSTLPVEEVKRSSSRNVTQAAEAEDAMSSLSAEEVDECSSDDEDWSKRHYKKRYAGSGKPRVYSRWKRKEERNVAEETDVQDASLDTSLFSPLGPGTSGHADNSSFRVSQSESPKKKRGHRRIPVLDDCRKSRRLAEKRDLKQRTEEQESVLAMEHHRALLKATDSEYDGESFAPRKKRPRLMPDKSDAEQKPVGAELWERSRFSAQNEPGDFRAANIYRSSERHIQNALSEFVMPSDISASSAEPADNNTGIVNSSAYLQSAFLDANGFLQPYIVGPDGILQPVVVNSSQFVETLVDSDGFLRPSVLQSEQSLLPSLVNACQLIQPMVLNFDEMSGSTGSSLCVAHMNAAGDAQNSVGKSESFTAVSSAEEGSVAGSSSQLSFSFDLASVPVDFTVAKSSRAEKSDRYSLRSTDKPIQVKHDGSSEDLMDCSDFTFVTETSKNERLEELNCEVDTTSGSLDQSCEENSQIQSNYKARESDKEATDQIQVNDSNLDVLVRASELMEKNCTGTGPETQYQALCVPPVELNIPSTVLHSYSGPGDADQVQMDSCTSYVLADGTDSDIVLVTGLAETGVSSLSTGQNADVNPISLHNRQLESAISSTQYSCISGDTAAYCKKSVSTDAHNSSVTTSNCMSHFSESDGLVTRAADVNHTVTSHVDCVMRIDTVSAEEETSKQSAGNECSQPTVGQTELLAASRAKPNAGSDTADEGGMDWTTTPTIVTVASSESPQSSLSSVEIVSTAQSENEMNDSIDNLKAQMTCSESESPIGSDATDHSSVKTSVLTSVADSSLCLASNQQSSDLPTHVPFANSSVSSSNTFCVSSASPQAMMSNVLPVLRTLPSVVQNATAAAVQQLTAMIMSQLLDSIQLQMHQSQLQGAQNLTSPLVNAILQSSGLPSSAGLQTIAGLQQPAVLQAFPGLQQPHMLQQSATLQQLADLQSSPRLQSSVAYQLQPPVGLLGASFPPDWSSSSGLQPGSALQVNSNLQPAMGLQHGAMMQATVGWQNSTTVEMGSSQQSSGCVLSNSGMQGSVDSKVDNVLSGKVLPAESNLQASPSQSTFSTVSKIQSPSQTFQTDNLSGSQRFSQPFIHSSPGNLRGSQPFIYSSPGNLPGSQPFLYHVPGNLVASQPLLHTLSGNLSGLYPLLHTAQGNFPGSQPLLQTVPENSSSSQSLLQQTVPGIMPGSQPSLETLPQNPSSEKAAAQQDASLHSQQLHDLISVNPFQSRAAMNPTASLGQQLMGCLVPQLSGQFQQPVSGNTIPANSYHQITSQGLGPYVDASVLQQLHSEQAAAYLLPVYPTNQADSLVYRSPTFHGYLPSFMGMQAMNSCPTALPVVSSSSSAPVQSSSTADQQTPAPAAVGSSAPESSK